MLIAKRFFMPIVFILLSALLLVTSACSAPVRPNLVFIMADDLGWRDLGCYGSNLYETPNIDQLAARGLRFTQAYAANPLCSPTRASILTGQYPARIGIIVPACHKKEEVLETKLAKHGSPKQRALQVDSVNRLKTDYVTLAELFKEAGYATGHFGKWHLGREPYSPLEHGFDTDIPHWYGPGPGGSYLAPWKVKDFKLPAKPGDHVEDLMADEAVKFIQAHKDGPFYLNYWAFSVHSPHGSKKALIDKYREKVAKLPAGVPQRNPLYAAMVECLDDAVGRIVKAIDDAGLTDRTIIVFFSDNGGIHWVYENLAKQGPMLAAPITSNAPLRGGKATIYEGGTREPCIIDWPGVTKPSSTTDTIIQSTDFFPTFVEMLDLTAPAKQKCDGVSFSPLLAGKAHDRGPLFCHFPRYVGKTKNLPSCYVRAGDWKLIRFFCDNEDQTDRFELYNLHDDISEQNNLAANKPDKVKELDSLIDRFLADTQAVVPKPNPNYGKTISDWIPSKGCRLSAAGSKLVIQATSRDPFIRTSHVPKAQGPYSFEIRMLSESAGKSQVFWTTNKGTRFQKDRSVFFDLQPDGQWHEYSVPLPVSAALRSLRLDPGPASKGTWRLEWIRLKDRVGEIVKDWRFGSQNKK